MIPAWFRCLPLALLVAAAACSATSDSTSPIDAAPGADAGGSIDTATVTDAAAAACPSRPDLVAAAPMCNTVANTAPRVPFTRGTGAPPAAAGGSIRDGLYEATRAEGFGTAAEAGRHITIVISSGATQWLWNGEVLDAAGAQVTSSFRVNATVSVSGTRVSFTTTCMSGPTSPLPAALNFTVAGETLVLFQDGPNAAATTYTRRGCTP